MMSELRQKFEALPLIYQLMDDGFVFVEVTQEYTRKDHTEHRLVIATVNGAWYAFQEQQSEIEKLKAEKAGLLKLAEQWREQAKELCRLDDKYVIGSLLSCAERLEEAVRGEHE